ncbi:putative enoyl-CoA hydratase 1 [compost metagenome]
MRFPAAVKVGARVRGRGEIVRVEQLGAAVQATVRVTMEIEGSERPGCVVDTISRYTFNPVA